MLVVLLTFLRIHFLLLQNFTNKYNLYHSSKEDLRRYFFCFLLVVPTLLGPSHLPALTLHELSAQFGRTMKLITLGLYFCVLGWGEGAIRVGREEEGTYMVGWILLLKWYILGGKYFLFPFQNHLLIHYKRNWSDKSIALIQIIQSWIWAFLLNIFPFIHFPTSCCFPLIIIDLCSLGNLAGTTALLSALHFITFTLLVSLSLNPSSVLSTSWRKMKALIPKLSFYRFVIVFFLRP